MPSTRGVEPVQGPRLYRELADWYPLLTPVEDYAEEAAFYRRLFEAHCLRPPQTLLDLGSGGGHVVASLKATLTCTLVDIASGMLALSRDLNPGCEHAQGDMRSVRLGRVRLAPRCRELHGGALRRRERPRHRLRAHGPRNLHDRHGLPAPGP